MATGKKEKVFVVGVGMTKFEKPGKTEGDYPDMARTAILRALHDAHVPFSAVQVAAAGYVYGDSTCGQRAVYSVGMTGIPIYNVNNNCSTGSTALYLGKQLVEGGLYSCVLAVGFEKMERGSLGTKYTDRTNPMDKHMETMSRTRGVTDAPFAPQMFGNAGREHMDKYGTQAKHFAMVALKNHKHSANNPYSQFRDQYTLEQIMASPRVFDPLTKLQCCPTSDGAAAAILCNERFVVEHNLQSQAIEIVSMVMKTDTLSTFQDSCIKMVGYDMSKAAAQEVYRQSGMTPNDVQVVELHDCFSCNELLTYEALGLCPEGQGGKLIETGAVTYGGKWVVNPSGGLISKGHPLGATGLAQCAELNWQLRNMCGPRQVPNCKYALQHNIGLGGAVVVTLYRAGFPSALKPYPPNLPNPALGQNFDDKGAAAPAGAPAASSVSLKSDALFAQIQAGLKVDPSVAKKVGGVYQFNVAGQDTKKTWTVDLKSSPPTVKDAAAEKADCIISVSDSDLCDLVSGKANGQKLFMAGKLKVQGNMAMTMKLDQLFKASKPSTAGASGAVSFKSDEVFAQVKAGLSADPSTAKKVGGVYQFNVTGDGGAKKTWAVDLKATPPVVKDAAADKPECTITLSDSDLVNLVAGKSNGQQLFMQGKLKIQGNMALAMKLDQLFKAGKNLPAAAAAAPAASAAKFASDAVFDQIKAGLKSDPSLAKKVGGVYQFNVTGDGGAKKTWAVDLKASPPVVKDSSADKPECTITIADADMVNMTTGKANGQQLFMQGKLKIQGNMALAMKLDQLVKKKASL